MRRDGRRSTNIDDRRGQQMAGMGGLGGGLMLMRFLPFLMRSKGGRFLLLIVGGLFLLSYFGLDGGLLGNITGMATGTTANREAALSPEQQELADFTSVVLADTEDTWNALFAEDNADYPEPTLVLFTGAVNSACGTGQAAMGPFYCPLDRQVYIDLSFFNELRTRFGADGDFAQAYVIAHEVGHHVQTVLGISDRVNSQQSRASSQEEANQYSVMQELQADCFAGLWANHANRSRQVIEQGDIEEALTAAQAIGDDAIQRQSQGYVRPESFTHGSSQQRMEWFNRGWEQGSLASCDTFSAQ
jgi:predicted metalloprotease